MDQENSATPKVDIALHYAAGGMHILPAMAGAKGAWLKEWQNRATTDAATIKTWWGLNPNSNIGWHPGPSGFVVLDLDREPGLRFFNERLRRWDPDTEAPPTRCHKTPNGYHLIYQVPEGESIGSGNLFLQKEPKGGLDFKSNGGYVIMPGSVVDGRSYQYVQSSPPVQVLPEMWLPMFDKPVGSDQDDSEWDLTPGEVNKDCRYCNAAVDDTIAKIASRPEGDRNDNLNAMVYPLYRLPCFDREEVYSLLFAAAQTSGLGDSEIRATLKSAIGAAEGEWGPQGAKENCSGLSRGTEPAPVVVSETDKDNPFMSVEDAVDRPTEYLIEGLAIRYKSVFLYGEGGIGKSTFASYLAMQQTEKTGRGTLVLVNEEDPEDLKNRWRAHGADPASVVAVDSSRASIDSYDKLAANLHHAETILKSKGYKGIGTIIVDPITEYLGAIKQKENELVRGALRPWQRMAADMDILSIHLSHTNKDESVSAVGAAYGSIAFINSYRVCLYFGHDPELPEDEWARAVVVAKSNKLPKGKGWRLSMGLKQLEFEDEDEWSIAQPEPYIEEIRETGAQLSITKMRDIQFGRHEKNQDRGWAKDAVRDRITEHLWDVGLVDIQQLRDIMTDNGCTVNMWNTALSEVKKKTGVFTFKVGRHGTQRWLLADRSVVSDSASLQGACDLLSLDYEEVRKKV